MKHLLIILFAVISVSLLQSCCSKKKKQEDSDIEIVAPFVKQDSEVSIEEELSKYLKDTVNLSYLIDGMLLPQRAETVCNLETIDKGDGWHEYKKGKYDFKLHVTGDYSFNDQINNSILYHGNRKVEFKGKKTLCFNPQKSDNYGINQMTTLLDPQVLRIGKEEFLFSRLIFNCNGIGCGMNIYFIYHLKTGKATFISDFRYEIDTPLLTDFERDGVPDLLIIEDDAIIELSPFNVDGYSINLIAFEFDNGSFKPKINPKTKSVYKYELTGIGDIDKKYQFPVSITKNNWFTMGSLQ